MSKSWFELIDSKSGIKPSDVLECVASYANDGASPPTYSAMRGVVDTCSFSQKDLIKLLASIDLWLKKLVKKNHRDRGDVASLLYYIKQKI